jgi:Fe-S cluster assembly iron-binding protein IscA
METTTSIPVTFTASAINELKKVIAADNSNRYLRVGAKGGGCSGLTYVLEMDERRENDELFEVEGIQCIMDKNHELYRGFTFTNPNASKTCGCGTSFAV